MSNSNRTAQITLPMVNLNLPENGKILDAGCGAGRTTIAIGKAIPNVNIVSFDRFDAQYIAGGGIELLSHNIKLAGIEDRVTIEKGDITQTQFPGQTFDAIVSSYMLDHLSKRKQKALQEVYRIMKPGGRFLLVIVVPNFSSFAIANILCLLISSRKKWIKWIEQTGFKMVCDGNINEGTYFCFEKPNKI
jgi:ubiquinone/menaquinone biosynthesis C-methylase UbiE